MCLDKYTQRSVRTSGLASIPVTYTVCNNEADIFVFPFPPLPSWGGKERERRGRTERKKEPERMSEVCLVNPFIRRNYLQRQKKGLQR